MKIVLLAVSAAFFAHTASTEELTYACNMSNRDHYNWIAPEYRFVIDTEAGGAQVASNHHDWTPASLKVRRDKDYRVLWNVTLPTAQNQDIRMKYQANLDVENNTIRVRASFAHLSASNKPFGTGACNIVGYENAPE